MSTNPTTPSSAESTVQFRLSTIFVLTLIAGVMAAFLSPRGNDLMLACLTGVLASALFALAVGYARPPLSERLFWGIVIAAMMAAVCAETTLLDRAGIYAWPLAAGLAAVVAAGNGGLYRRMFLSALIAAGIIAVYLAALGATSWPLVVAYIACASIGAALMTVLIETVNWTEKRFRIPQPAVGLLLVFAAIGFSLAAPQVIPGW